MVLSGFVFGLAPVVAFAQDGSVGLGGSTTTPITGSTPTVCTAGGITNLQGIMCKFSELFNAVLPVLIGLAVVYFVFGVVSYVIASEEEAKTKGRDRIIYGIIGLAVIIGMWALVLIVRNTFLASNSNTQNINFPTVPY